MNVLPGPLSRHGRCELCDEPFEGSKRRRYCSKYHADVVGKARRNLHPERAGRRLWVRFWKDGKEIVTEFDVRAGHRMGLLHQVEPRDREKYLASRLLEPRLARRPPSRGKCCVCGKAALDVINCAFFCQEHGFAYQDEFRARGFELRYWTWIGEDFRTPKEKARHDRMHELLTAGLPMSEVRARVDGRIAA